MNTSIELHHLGRVDYEPTVAAMQAFTSERSLQPAQNVRDQLWICEHPPVYTQGLAGKAEHIFSPGDIPVVQTNRGGQVTYHGPGQVVGYPLMDLHRAGYFVKEYVFRIEEAVLRTLLHFGITGHRVVGAPGIYVRLDDPRSHARLPVPSESAQAPTPGTGPFDWLRSQGAEVGKIAALGIKVSRHCTYHGVALNVAMDLEPYARINPCGYAQLQTVDLSTIGVCVGWSEAADVLGHKLTTHLAP